MAATVPLSKLEQEHHLVTAFSFFDKDGNGHIARDELELAFEGYNMEGSLLQGIIEAVDQNQVKLLLRQECLHYCKFAIYCLTFWHHSTKPLSLRGDQWSEGGDIHWIFLFDQLALLMTGAFFFFSPSVHCNLVLFFQWIKQMMFYTKKSPCR